MRFHGTTTMAVSIKNAYMEQLQPWFYKKSFANVNRHGTTTMTVSQKALPM